MNANKNLNFSLLKMKKTGDTIVWLSTIDMSSYLCIIVTIGLSGTVTEI